MPGLRPGIVVALAALCAALVACGGGGSPSTAATCGPPPPVPIPLAFLSYPEPGATAVPDAIGDIVVVASVQDYFGPTSISLATSSNVPVPVGTYTSPPSPLPTPYAVPTGFQSPIPFLGVPVPAFSPATTYVVTYNFRDFGNTPPACRSQNSTTLGSFTTK